MHFKNSVKPTNLKVLLKAVKEVKSTMSTGKQFHTSTTRFTTRFTKNAATTFVLLLCLYSLWFDLMECVWRNRQTSALYKFCIYLLTYFCTYMPEISQLSGFNVTSQFTFRFSHLVNLFDSFVRGIVSIFGSICSQKPECAFLLPSSTSMFLIHDRPDQGVHQSQFRYGADWLIFFHILVNLTITARPMAVLSFISSAQSASFVNSAPEIHQRVHLLQFVSVYTMTSGISSAYCAPAP